ncbi:unnamed protein product [Nippostrongylus brasiliensis]|uniref:Rna-directed dna polymerase from mobile element jockey-like n=1 Tax=Nippostrongylus brasiliensis TaxID=27835 RepID=A0A0N4Y8Y9_NIPBR|nr:unnamed protein product [Nippostrongylus brasiliensis]
MIVDAVSTWQTMKVVVYEAALSQLGVNQSGRRMIDRQTWLWTDEVKEKICAKKRPYNAFLCNKIGRKLVRVQESKESSYDDRGHRKGCSLR